MASTKTKRSRRKTATKPWKRSAPKGSGHKKVTATQKRSAKAAAKKAGRPYPNLVDNMRAASKKKARRRKS